MAVGWSSYTVTAVLNAIGNNTAFSVAQAYAKLHVGDPGANGTANPAGNTTRKAVSFGTAASAAMANDADVDWTSGEVTTTEDYSHISLWDASSGGNFLGSGTIGANPVTAGDTFKLAAGDIDMTAPVAS